MNEKNEIHDDMTLEEMVHDKNVVEQTPKKQKKHIQALEMVEKSKTIVQNAQDQTQECKLLLMSDLEEYDNAKKSLYEGGLEECSKLLEKVGSHSVTTDEEVSPDVVFEPKDEIAPLMIKNLSSGKFTGMIYGIIVGLATALGLIYVATEKLGITLDITKIPSQDVSESVMGWFATLVGSENLYVGIAIFVAAILFMTSLVYLIRTALKGNANLHFATKQLAEAEHYTQQKGDCKTEMDKVDAHIKQSINILKMYEVLFNEQKGKLERIVHIEGQKEKSSEYHQKSYLEIRETRDLLSTIKSFMGVSMSEEGKLSEKSVLLLERAKANMDKVIERLY